jgi:hypothetical protein
MADGWTIGAAIATGIAGVAALGTWPFVAWQALETRKAARTASDALVASTAMAIDAARARLDAGAPRVSVAVNGPKTTPQGKAHGGGVGSVWPIDGQRHGIFQFPRDAGPENSLWVVYEVGITAYGDQPMHMACEGDLYADDASTSPLTSIQLTPNPPHLGGPRPYVIQLRILRRPDEWAENYEALAAGQPLPHVARGTISIAGYGDTGVIDTWEVSFEAWPLEPVPDLASQWQFCWADPMAPEWVRHEQHPLARRSYWLSRSQNVRLPEPTYKLRGPELPAQTRQKRLGSSHT